MARRHYLQKRPKRVYTPEALQFLAQRVDQKHKEAAEAAEKAAKLAKEAEERQAALDAEKAAQEAAKKLQEAKAAIESAARLLKEQEAREEEERKLQAERILRYVDELKKRRDEDLRRIREEMDSRLPRILAHPHWRLFSRRAQAYALTLDHLCVLERLECHDFRLECEKAARTASCAPASAPGGSNAEPLPSEKPAPYSHSA